MSTRPHSLTLLEAGMFKLVSVWQQTAQSLEHIRLYKNPYLPHEYRYPLDTGYTTPGDLYFDRSREDSGYIAAAFLLRTFQLDSALQHIKNCHHILLSECVSKRGLCLYLCTQWPRIVIMYCYLSVYLRGDCVCTCVHSG